MPESEANDSTQDGNNTSEKTSGAGDEFKAITTQADLDKIIGERVKRERDKYADYKDLKSKADEFDKLAEANKSEIEKANDRVTKAEAEVAKIPTAVSEQLKAHLVQLHEISDEDAELFLTATDPELLLKQVSRLLGRENEQKKTNNFSAREGDHSTAKPTPADAFAAAVESAFS